MYSKKIKMLLGVSALALTMIVSSCDKDSVSVMKPDVTFYALSGGTKLLKINAMTSDMATSTTAITGLMTGETLTAIDFRPATGELYGVSTQNRLYVINQETGAARVIGTAPLNPVVSGSAVALDFNPTVDRIR